MRAQDYEDPNPGYWAGYTNLQHVKHGLIRAYLNGWFPILSSWAGRVLYIDTHAGRGRHTHGRLGSPLVALNALLEHRMRARILSACEVRFIFLERDPANLRALESELQSCEPLPQGITIERHAVEFENVMRKSLAGLRSSGVPMAPSFIFVDPYGFKLPYALLHEFMEFEAVEVFVNVMWRHLDMAMAQAQTVSGKGRLLDFVFGSTDWREIAAVDGHEHRCERILSLIKQIIDAKWATSIRMLGSNDATEYVLLHLTNHDAGRDLMKRAMWRVCPSLTGRFIARKADDPAQQVLLCPQPDLTRLERRIVAILNQQTIRWRALYTMIRSDLWLETHVNQVVNQLLKQGTILPSEYEGKCTPKNNPLLRLSQA